MWGSLSIANIEFQIFPIDILCLSVYNLSMENTKTFLVNVSDRLKELLPVEAMTKTDLALWLVSNAGFSVSAAYDWLNGSPQRIDLPMLYKACAALKCTPNDILKAPNGVAEASDG